MYDDPDYHNCSCLLLGFSAAWVNIVWLCVLWGLGYNFLMQLKMSMFQTGGMTGHKVQSFDWILGVSLLCSFHRYNWPFCWCSSISTNGPIYIYILSMSEINALMIAHFCVYFHKINIYVELIMLLIHVPNFSVIHQV